jgi:hypothetical protein
MQCRLSATLCVAASLCASLPAMAQTSTPTQLGPLKPGGLRLTTRIPEPGNWVAQSAKDGRSILTCKPLACAAASTVVVSTTPTPARKPDPQALEKFAKVQVPKFLQAADAARAAFSSVESKLEILASKVTTHKGYPSVLNESKRTQGTNVVFISSAMIFAGPVMIMVQSISPDRAVAMKSLNLVIGAMSIQEGPPLSPEGPTPVSPEAPASRPPVIPDRQA